jgi:hypothetical protein
MRTKKVMLTGMVAAAMTGGMLFAAGPALADDTQARKNPCVVHGTVLKNNFRYFDVAAHGGDADGRVSPNDMKRVAQLGGKKVKKAARFFLANPEIFNALDTAAQGDWRDERISPIDVDAFLKKLPSACRK